MTGRRATTGLRAATGDAIAWLDADDTWRPHHVEVVGGLLERHPDAVAAFGAAQRFGLDDSLIPGYVPASGVPEEVLLAAFRDWLHIPTGAVVRRSALLAVGGFDEDERYAVDFDLWLRLAHRSRFVSTNEVTADWRWHEAQKSATPQHQFAAVYRYRRRFLDRLADAGEAELRVTLENEFRTIWRTDLSRALAARDPQALRAVASYGEHVCGVSSWQWRAWYVSARLPIPLLAAARDIRHTLRAHRPRRTRV